MKRSKDNRALRILLLEDNPEDADLSVRKLTKAGFHFTPVIARNSKEFKQFLEKQSDEREKSTKHIREKAVAGGERSAYCDSKGKGIEPLPLARTRTTRLRVRPSATFSIIWCLADPAVT